MLTLFHWIKKKSLGWIAPAWSSIKRWNTPCPSVFARGGERQIQPFEIEVKALGVLLQCKSNRPWGSPWGLLSVLAASSHIKAWTQPQHILLSLGDLTCLSLPRVSACHHAWPDKLCASRRDRRRPWGMAQSTLLRTGDCVGTRPGAPGLSCCWP